ncbi:GGDEF domain-containing protein [Tsukamurella soli]|uniref:GGDEF domain-containing protein n=1 Tax=Tsukamurella soli TaxID=644556 RepID=A0ABP8KFF5_9ACTN
MESDPAWGRTDADVRARPLGRHVTLRRRELGREFAVAFDREGRGLRSELWIVMLVGVGAVLVFHAFLLDVPGALLPWTPLLLIGIGIPVVLRWLSGSQSPLRRWSAALFIAAAYLDVACMMTVRIVCLEHGMDVLPVIVPVCILMSLIVAQIRFVLLAPAILLGLLAIMIAELTLLSVTSGSLFDLMAAVGIVCVSLASAYELENSSRAAWHRQGELDELTRSDSLTGLPNRRHLAQTLSDVVESSAGRGSVVVAIFDVDQFKVFNDELGHPAGDECLRAIGALLRERVDPAHEFAARYAGEEFAIVWRDVEPESARARADRLRRSVGELNIARPEGAGVLTVSAGTAELRVPAGVAPEHSSWLIHALVDRADRALYSAKESGRDRIVHDRTVISAVDQDVPAATHARSATDAFVEPQLRATALGLRFRHPKDEARFRATFEEQGRRTRRFIMVGFLTVVAVLVIFPELLLRLPRSAADFGRWVDAIGFVPAAVLALIGASWHRLRTWSAPIYIGAVTVILTAQMFERVVQTPKGFDVVPFLMPVSVLLSLCVVRIVYSLLMPSMVVLVAAVITCEVATAPMTGNEVLTISTSTLVAFVAVRFAYRLEKSRRLDWSRSIQLEALSLTDPLTRMANRRSFISTLRDELAAGRGPALLLLDVDRFKDYNDRFGHLAGDDCLRTAGSQVRRAADACDGFAARLGGEEFAVILPGGAGVADVAEAVRAAVTGSRPDAGGAASGITASAGLAAWPADTPVADPDAATRRLMERADRALYEAKRNGRARLVSFVVDSSKKSSE